IVVIVQVNLIVLRGHAALFRDKTNTGNCRFEREKIWHSRVQLICESPRLETVYFCSQKIPSKLYVVVTKSLIGDSRQGRVFLVQRRRSCVIPECSGSERSGYL